jgi:hypothetical protein
VLLTIATGAAFALGWAYSVSDKTMPSEFLVLSA